MTTNCPECGGTMHASRNKVRLDCENPFCDHWEGIEYGGDAE